MEQNEKRFGPVSTSDITQLQIFFEQNSIDFEVEIDEGLKAEADKLMHSDGNGEYDPNTRRTVKRFDYQQAKFLYVFVKNEDAAKVKDLLFTLGHATDAESLSQQGTNTASSGHIEGEEYFCTECDYHSYNQGTCPKHGTRLLEYYECLKARREIASSTGAAKTVKFVIMIGAYALIIGVIGGSIYAFYQSFQ